MPKDEGLNRPKKRKTEKFKTDPGLASKMMKKGKDLGRDYKRKSAKSERLSRDMILD